MSGCILIWQTELKMLRSITYSCSSHRLIHSYTLPPLKDTLIFGAYECKLWIWKSWKGSLHYGDAHNLSSTTEHCSAQYYFILVYSHCPPNAYQRLKLFHSRPLKTYVGCKGLAPLILNLRNWWIQLHSPATLQPGKETLVYSDWAPQSVWMSYLESKHDWSVVQFAVYHIDYAIPDPLSYWRFTNTPKKCNSKKLGLKSTRSRSYIICPVCFLTSLNVRVLTAS